MVSDPLIIGHRGASTFAPENTLAAFSRALADGADGIEFDVRLSLDSVPVVIHDDNLNRTAALNRKVTELSAAELGRCDVSQWFNARQNSPTQFSDTVPTLARVFELIKPTNAIAYLELKSDAAQAALLVQKVVAEIFEVHLSDRIIVSSFDLKAVELVKRLEPKIHTAALFEPKFSRPLSTVRRLRMIDLALQHSANEIALHYTLASPRVVAGAQKRGLEVAVWTVDEVVWVKRAAALGIKAIITNNPALLISTRDSPEGQLRPNSAG